MRTRPMLEDADADIAALVYSAGDRPDRVLCDFARRVADSGRRACGLIQFRRRPFDGARRRVMIVDRWRIDDVARSGAENDHCTLDEHWLERMAARTQTSISQGVDLVIVNRFGPLEAAGRGFCGAIRAASATETPLVIAVPHFEFARWTSVSNGMAIKLDCTLDAVLDWWRRLATRRSRPPLLDPRACELLK